MNGTSSQPRSPWSLWIVLIAVMPVPYWAIESGRETVVQLSVFALATGAVAVTEPAGVTFFIAGLFWLQMLLYGWLLLRLSRAMVRRIPSRLVRIGVVALLIYLCATVAVYRTPFATTGMTATLPELYGSALTSIH